MVIMQHAGRDGRSGRVPIVNGHRGQRNAFHLAVDIKLRHLNPIVDIQQMVESQMDKSHNTFNGVLENPGHQSADDTKDDEVAGFLLDFDDAEYSYQPYPDENQNQYLAPSNARFILAQAIDVRHGIAHTDNQEHQERQKQQPIPGTSEGT